MVVSKGNGLSTRVFNLIEVGETLKSSKEDYSPILDWNTKIEMCLGNPTYIGSRHKREWSMNVKLF